MYVGRECYRWMIAINEHDSNRKRRAAVVRWAASLSIKIPWLACLWTSTNSRRHQGGWWLFFVIFDGQRITQYTAVDLVVVSLKGNVIKPQTRHVSVGFVCKQMATCANIHSHAHSCIVLSSTPRVDSVMYYTHGHTHKHTGRQTLVPENSRESVRVQRTEWLAHALALHPSRIDAQIAYVYIFRSGIRYNLNCVYMGSSCGSCASHVHSCKYMHSHYYTQLVTLYAYVPCSTVHVCNINTHSRMTERINTSESRLRARCIYKELRAMSTWRSIPGACTNVHGRDVCTCERSPGAVA